jgi:hypothetical protein
VVGRRPGKLAVVTNITEGAKKKIEKSQFAVEESLLYPLLRGRDVMRWHSKPSAAILMMQDPETRKGIAVRHVEEHYPKGLLLS